MRQLPESPRERHFRHLRAYRMVDRIWDHRPTTRGWRAWPDDVPARARDALASAPGTSTAPNGPEAHPKAWFMVTSRPTWRFARRRRGRHVTPRAPAHPDPWLPVTSATTPRRRASRGSWLDLHRVGVRRAERTRIGRRLVDRHLGLGGLPATDRSANSERTGRLSVNPCTGPTPRSTGDSGHRDGIRCPGPYRRR